MTRTVLHLGYAIDTGKAVAIPVNHMAVTGQTQVSGKTTTLEALIARSDLRAVAFVTKRAEGGFTEARRIPPYFRERADWQFVASILEATMREKMRFERAWIMRACKGAKTLADVQRNVVTLMEKARGMSADMYLQLNEYLAIVVPQVQALPFADRVDLAPGINVMDLGAYTMEVQALVIRSVLEWVYQRERNTVVIIPEAWEFIPQRRGSPVLLAAEELIRKGAAAGNFVWLDSQDIAGVHKAILKSVIVWILGVQREANEVKRMLAHIPSVPKPTVNQVMQLGNGEFFACWGHDVVKVYVQPAWLDGQIAQDLARHGGSRIWKEGEFPPIVHLEAPRRPWRVPPGVVIPTVTEQVQAILEGGVTPIEEDDEMSAEERAAYETRIAKAEEEAARVRQVLLDLKKEKAREEDAAKRQGDVVAALRRQLEGVRALKAAWQAVFGNSGAPGPSSAAVDVDAIVAQVVARVGSGGGVTVVVTPPAALRAQFQEEEVERVLEFVRGLPPRPAAALLLLESSEQILPQKRLGERLGVPTSGESWIKFGTGLRTLIDRGFIESVERHGLKGTLRKKLAEDLAVYQPSAEDLEATYQRILHALVMEEA